MSTLSEFRTIINAEIKASVSSTVTQQAQVTEESMNKIVNNMTVIKEKEVTLHDNMRLGIRAISTLQLLRFAMKDVQDIASGKGGLQDILSLATSTMLVINNINDLLRSEIALQTISNALMVVGATLSALNPVTAGLMAAGAVIVGGQVIAGAVTGLQERREATRIGEQRFRLQAYRSIVGQ